MSVVIPTWNRPAYLREALESVFAQTFTDYEVIVVDDGSTDETPQVARSFGERVRIVRQKHQGPGAARNRGVEEARGKYIAFLDSDDIWLPRKLALQVAELEKHGGVGAVASRAEMFGNRGIVLRCPSPVATRESLDAEAIFRWQPMIQTPTVLVDKECFREAGGFDPSLPVAEDLDFWLRLAALRPIRYLPHVLARYRAHPASLIGTWKLHHLKAGYEVLNRFLHNHPELQRAWKPWMHDLMFQRCYECLVYPFLIQEDRSAVREYVRRARAHCPWRLKTYFHELLTWLPKRAFKAWRRRWSESVALRLRMRTYECLLQGRMERARIYARIAVSYRPLRIKNYLYLLFSRLPPSAYTLARSLKQRAWPLSPR